jgi:hypothetical protein
VRTGNQATVSAISFQPNQASGLSAIQHELDSIVDRSKNTGFTAKSLEIDIYWRGDPCRLRAAANGLALSGLLRTVSPKMRDDCIESARSGPLRDSEAL